MNDLTREELKHAIDASEARVATVVESFRADSVELRAELREGNSLLKAQSERLQAQAIESSAAASKFYADAGRLLAEIKLGGEQNKTAMMGTGYKVLAWLFGALLTVFGAMVGIATLTLAVYKAITAAVGS